MKKKSHELCYINEISKVWKVKTASELIMLITNKTRYELTGIFVKKNKQA